MKFIMFFTVVIFMKVVFIIMMIENLYRVGLRENQYYRMNGFGILRKTLCN